MIDARIGILFKTRHFTFSRILPYPIEIDRFPCDGIGILISPPIVAGRAVGILIKIRCAFAFRRCLFASFMLVDDVKRTIDKKLMRQSFCGSFEYRIKLRRQLLKVFRCSRRSTFQSRCSCFSMHLLHRNATVNALRIINVRQMTNQDGISCCELFSRRNRLRLNRFGRFRLRASAQTPPMRSRVSFNLIFRSRIRCERPEIVTQSRRLRFRKNLSSLRNFTRDLVYAWFLGLEHVKLFTFSTCIIFLLPMQYR